NQLDRVLLSVIGYVFISLLAILCIIPFLMIISSSLTEESKIVEAGFQLIPTAFSLDAYELLFKYPGQMLKAYGVTISVTLLGTVAGLFLTAMTAYVLARKDFKWRN